MYGKELKYTRLCNWKGRLIFALFGEIYPAHLIRYFVNRKCLKQYRHKEYLDILEIGFNNGAFSYWLSRNSSFNVVGIDNDEKFVADCGYISKKINRKNIKFICADASQLLNLERRFDFIFSSHVLEHIDDDCAVFRNAFRNMKENGYLVLQVPYGNPDKGPIYQDLVNGHVREGYSIDDICKKVKAAGFKIVSAGGSVGKIGQFAYRFGM